jgi:hypothetical protein
MDKVMVGKIKKFLAEREFKFGMFDMTQTVHKIGLPNKTYILVKPEYSLVDGSMTILVSADCMARYTLLKPYMHHEWRLNKTIPYSNKSELVRDLSKMAKEPKGPWA